MHNEEETVDAFYARVVSALDGLPFELIITDDASKDSTPEKLEALCEKDDRVKVISLSRNFGHQSALTAGLEHATGDAVVMIDGDLQDPPELILKMVEEWLLGADVVYAVRESREGETRFKKATASWFYKMFEKLARLDLGQNSGDFRLVDRRALDALLCLKERNRFLRGMTVWIGFKQTAITYKRDPRFAGETKFTLSKMMRFAFDAISSFSWFPLQLATLLGFVFATIAFIGLPLVVIARIAGAYVPGVSTILFAVLLIGGIQLITVGIIGEYVGRIYDEVKQRPLYIVSGRRNV
jgi:dolichol-phosphate mannosyltransferase